MSKTPEHVTASMLSSFVAPTPVRKAQPGYHVGITRLHSQGKPLVPKQRLKRPRARRMLMTGGRDTGKSLPEFDRDYYDELKTEFADHKNVQIFSKEDYELNSIQAPWLYDDRGRDLKEVRKALANDPLEDGELDEVPSRPMRYSDLHTDEEIETFETQLRDSDAVGGRVWLDPMPESDFEGDPRWIDFRKVESDVVESVQAEQELLFDGMDAPPLRRQQYASEEEEIKALQETCDKMQAEHLHRLYEELPENVAHGENVPVPEPSEFARWQREAEARGGNSTKFESYFLSPFQRNNMSAQVGDSANPEEVIPPPQYLAIGEANLGKWEGSVTVFPVPAEQLVPPAHGKRCPVRSDISFSLDGSMQWTTVASNEEKETVSAVTFSKPDWEDALIPGRGVSKDGNYVSAVESAQAGKGIGSTISVSPGFIRNITENQSCNAVVEFGLINKADGVVQRNRVLLCATQSRDSGTSQRVYHRVSSVVVITELRRSNEAPKVSATSPAELKFVEISTISMEKLMGSWKGAGTLLHPEYPPMPCRNVQTHYSVVQRRGITEEDVTWTESDISDHPKRESKRRVRTLGKKKVSKRVAAARAHDRKRLSACTFLSIESIGEHTEKEKFAWQPVPSRGVISSLHSPRLGRFVNDYCGMMVSDFLLLTFPVAQAFPSMWNTISLVELNSPSRTRITAGRNEAGSLVGVLFVSETVEEGLLCDSVSLYV